MEKLAMSVQEMAKVLGIGYSHAYNLTHVKGFPAIRIGRRIIIPNDGLKKWVDEHWGEWIVTQNI